MDTSRDNGTGEEPTDRHGHQQGQRERSPHRHGVKAMPTAPGGALDTAGEQEKHGKGSATTKLSPLSPRPRSHGTEPPCPSWGHGSVPSSASHGGRRSRPAPAAAPGPAGSSWIQADPMGRDCKAGCLAQRRDGHSPGMGSTPLCSPGHSLRPGSIPVPQTPGALRVLPGSASLWVPEGAPGLWQLQQHLPQILL